LSFGLDVEVPIAAALGAPATIPAPTAAPAETFAELSRKLLLFNLFIGIANLLALPQDRADKN